MATTFQRHPFSKEELEELLRFSQKHGLPPFHQRSLVRRFLTDLVSSTDFIFDLFDKGERVALAALLDRPKNAANSANLEIVGLKPDSDVNSLFATLLGYSKASLPPSRSAVDVSYHESYPVPLSVFTENGFVPTYTCYDMETDHPKFYSVRTEPSFHLSRLTESDFEEYHRVVLAAFEKNEDANIPPLEEMRPHLLSARIPPTVLRADGRIIGFLYLKKDDGVPDSGEVNTIGLLPEYRGRGLGAWLLQEGLKQLRDHGVRRFRLSVSANNERALCLYQHAGFEIQEKFANLRWTR